MHTILKALRAAGWMVGVHNDYRLNGEPMTFWLITHAQKSFFVKAEGRVEDEDLVLAELKEKADKMLFGAAIEGEERPELAPPAPIEPTRTPQGAPDASRRAFGEVSEACAETITRAGKGVSYEVWKEGEWLTWFGRLKAKLMAGCVEPPRTFNVREKTCMRRLVKWLGPRKARKFLEFIVRDWPSVKKRFRINGTATINVVWGFRENLVSEFQGGSGDAPELSRTHRSAGATEGKNMKKAGWNIPL